MTDLIFATANIHKAQEIQSLLPAGFAVRTMKEAGWNEEIPEPFFTLDENAVHKATVIHNRSNSNCFAEDTGLEVEALNGEPGVFSARYAGEPRSDAANIALLLQRLEAQTRRQARFRTVMALWFNGQLHLFEGICQGTIATAARGTSGFGYDPVFQPEDSTLTFAEMGLAEKNQFSHRKKALAAMISFLTQEAAL